MCEARCSDADLLERVKKQNRLPMTDGTGQPDKNILNLKSAKPAPPQEGGNYALFLKCTSEVTKWFLYMNEHFCIKNNKFGGKGVSGGLDLCHFHARKVAWV